MILHPLLATLLLCAATGAGAQDSAFREIEVPASFQASLELFFQKDGGMLRPGTLKLAQDSSGRAIACGFVGDKSGLVKMPFSVRILNLTGSVAIDATTFGSDATKTRAIRAECQAAGMALAEP